ncbi:hypothetical protein G7Z17_g6191 [Cylindrodendrum hubeiense]|uniref:DUF7770 domain-containing protein n=1 Tax=Cylindrodendrum hubeiense TaxID=595255 RepID=A0A9P5H568_9HYPO|nr:hypothetical protein G7Z17_g6191 [Cylindrodendrum hubeiense]
MLHEFPSTGQGGKKASHTNFEMENLDPVSYIPEAAKSRIRSSSRIVTFVQFVAHSVLPNGGNHWKIFLQTGEHEFVQLEISPGAWPGREGYLGRLDIMDHRHMLTHNHHQTVSIPAEPGHRVVSFLDAIVRADNHRYEFTQKGRGCTGWVRDQFYLFTQAHLIPSGWESRFEAAIRTAWDTNVSLGSWPVTYGTYLRDRSGNRRQGRRHEGPNPDRLVHDVGRDI